MHMCIDLRPVMLSATALGLSTNLGFDAASRRDRADGLWYITLRAPRVIVNVYATVDGPSFSYLGRGKYFHFPTRS